MNVGDSVRLAIDVWEMGEADAAMLFACLAVDGTACKTFPGEKGTNARFTRLLRDNYSVLGPMGAPGINLSDTRFPVQLPVPKADGGIPDVADLIYGIHRCHHGHGEDLPGGFELIPDARGPAGSTRLAVSDGRVQLSDRMIFGLLAVAVVAPVNSDQVIPDSYFLTFSNQELPIAEWWGRAADFATTVAALSLPSVTLDFGDWMDSIRPTP